MSKKWFVAILAGILLAVVLAYGFQQERPPTAQASPFNADRAFTDLQTIVGFGPRPAGSEPLARTRAYIVEELKKAGLTPQLDEFEAVTPRGRVRMTNIRASRAGSIPAMITLAGHYDTKIFSGFSFVGANDGGSSAAWLLEMARATRNLTLNHTLEFIFFDGEEAVQDWTATDSLYGSRQDVERRIRDGSLRQLKALILVDMIGDSGLVIHRESQSTPWLTTSIWNAARSLGYTREFSNQQHTIEDDHIPYLRAAVPAVDLIDFEYGPDHRYWHTAGDTLDKTSGRSLKIVGDAVYASLPEIDRQASAN